MRAGAKHEQLREVLLRALDAGYWAPGHKFPTETELTQLTPFSLGTVQRAIRSLVEDGLIVRRRGHGSFVTDMRSRMHNPLNFRFLSDDGASYLPVFPKVLSRQRDARSGPWSRHLGLDGRAALRIDRLLDIGGEFSVYSRLYVDPQRFGLLAQRPVKELHAANFTKLVGQASNVPVSHLSQAGCVIRLADPMASALKVKPGACGMLLEIICHASDGAALYFQEIFIPATERRLMISERADAGKAAVPV